MQEVEVAEVGVESPSVMLVLVLELVLELVREWWLGSPIHDPLETQCTGLACRGW